MKTRSLLLQLIDEAYEKQTWHGPNLRASVRGLSAGQALWRPGPGRHNIWEIVVHAAYWKYTVRRRLLGEKRGSFPLEGSNWFPRSDAANAKAWKDDLQLLDECHRSMRKAIASIPESKLNIKSPNSKYTNVAIIYGIANHDIYHAGQIRLLKRLMKK
jgi:uncharacterized damage-inducible protein DinB